MSEAEYSLAGEGSSAIEVKGSRFYGFAGPVLSRSAFERALADIRSRHHDATHIAYAFRLGAGGSQESYSDAGEPPGTAGAPIMRVLRGMNVTDAFVAVVRYFGGIKLGTGGLARAYAEAARAALENAKLTPYRPMLSVIAHIPYGAVAQWAIFVDRAGGVIVDQSFSEDVVVTARIPQSALEDAKSLLAELTKGKSRLEVTEG